MPKYKLNEDQRQLLLQGLDIFIKENGIDSLQVSSGVVNLLNNPLDQDDEGYVYEFEEEHLQTLVDLIDVQLKDKGLDILRDSITTIQTLNNPLQDEGDENPDVEPTLESPSEEVAPEEE